MFKKLSIFSIVYFLLVNTSYSEIISEFNITGNDRVSAQTIINFSEFNKGANITDNDLNNILKKIYETNFFEDVSVDLKNSILTINVKEHPIIQDIKFEGIKATKFVEALIDEISLKPKGPFNKFTLKRDQEKVLNILKQSGYYFATVDVQKEDNPNKTINLIYNVKMGEKAFIKKIKFIGDKKFKSRKLNSVITSEESKFWKFLSKKKFLDKARTDLDKRLLKNFYLNKGFYNVIIEQAFTQILDNKSFSLTYKINAGEKFLFNNFDLIIPQDFDEIKFNELKKVFKSLENTTYSYSKIESILDVIDKISLKENYEFINAVVTENIVENNKINFIFNIKDGDKFYVDRINISGNNITKENYIRQQLIVDEGDPFNTILHTKSINKIKATNIFKSVKSKVSDSTNSGQKIIDISVEEKPTGEISAGAGYGSAGSTVAFGIKENNFKGEGIKLNFNVNISADAIKGGLAYTQPNFAYSDKSVTTSIESTSTDKEKDYGYKSSLNKIALGTRFEQFENFYFSPNLSISNEVLTTTQNASANYKKQEGSYFDALFNYNLTNDKRNSPYRPDSGYVSTWSQELPIVSDGMAVSNGYTFTHYQEFLDDMIVTLGVYGRTINSLRSNKDVRVSKRLYMPETKLRGFEAGKIGPKDGNDFVGGNYSASFNASTTLPFLFPTFEKIDFLLFFDAANLWHVDYSANVDQGNTVRSATGIAIDVITPMGPLSFSLAQPLTEANGDVTESFRFNLGTTF